MPGGVPGRRDDRHAAVAEYVVAFELCRWMLRGLAGPSPSGMVAPWRRRCCAPKCRQADGGRARPARGAENIRVPSRPAR